MLNFKSTFPLSFFTLIKRLFSYYLCSAIRVVSSAYLRLLILLPVILIPTSASFILEFCMIYFAYKYYKQGDDSQSSCILLLILNQSIVPQSQKTDETIHMDHRLV